MTRDALRAAAQAEVDRWESALTDELVRLFDRQEAVVLARLTGTKARKHTRHWMPPGERKIDARYVLDVARWVTDAAAAARPVLGRLFGRVYKRVAEQVTAAAPEPDETPLLGDDDPRVTGAVEDRLARVGDGVKTAAEEVQDYIDREDAAGTPMPQIADGVRALYAARKDTWAQRIATVSAVGAINHASLLAAMDAGSSAKQWLSSRDDKVRPTHRHADGQVRLLDERFRLGGIPEHPGRSLLMFPGDPAPTVPIDEVINCRCTLVFSPPRKRAGAGSPVAAAKGHEVEQTASYSSPGTGGEWLEVKDKVRTQGGVEQYGLPIGATIRRDKVPTVPTFSSPAAAPVARPGATVGTIPGVGIVDDASADVTVLALVKKFNPGVDLAGARAIALRDSQRRVGAFVAWAPDGKVLAVSVHPALKGRGIGDEMVEIAQDVDLRVKPPKRTPRPSQQQSFFPPPPKPEKPKRPPRPIGEDGLPIIDDLSADGDEPGTSGDFDADAKRIDRLQKAYLADKADTESLFADKYGRWTPEREAQQQEIIDFFLNQPGIKAEQKLVVMAGMPGSGKTTTINSAAGQAAVGVNLDEYVTVNSDAVKEEMIRRGMVPEYPGLAPEEAITLYQPESFQIATALMRQAAARGLNYVYDTTLRLAHQADHATGAARSAKRDYEATYVLVDVPPATAISRARSRYLSGDRYVPESFIAGLGLSGSKRQSAPAREFDTVKRNPGRWFVFDNAGTEPVLAAQGVTEKRPPRPREERGRRGDRS